MIPAVSASTSWLAVAIVPPVISLRISSVVFTPIRWPRSETLIASSRRMIFFSSAISVICVF